MKANNQTADPDVKDVQVEEKVLEVAPLVKPNEVKKMFLDIDTKIQHFEKFSSGLVVENEQTLVIAENNASEINGIIKNIEKVRTIRKKPYIEAGKMIDTFAKSLSKPLEDVKAHVNSIITNYKKVQQAAARVEAEKEQRRIEAIADEKMDETNRMARIENQLIGRLYGGYWLNKNNERKSSSGCLNSLDCENLSAIIQEKIPKPSDFEHFSEEYSELIDGILNKLSEHKANLIQLEGGSKALKEDAQEAINQAKIKAGIEVVQEQSKKQTEIVKEAKKEIKSTQSAVKDAGKGVRKNLKFDVYDLSAVPKEFLIVDEIAVRQWASERKEMVKQKIKDGEVIIDGINFYLEDSYVSR